MFRVEPLVIFLTYVLIAIAGLVLGVVSGLIFGRVFKLQLHGAEYAKTALLGAIGAVGTVIGCAIIPWPRNTVSTTLGTGIQLESTMNRFQHPYAAAIIIAIFFPAFHQFIRARHRKSAQN